MVLCSNCSKVLSSGTQTPVRKELISCSLAVQKLHLSEAVALAPSKIEAMQYVSLKAVHPIIGIPS